MDSMEQRIGNFGRTLIDGDIISETQWKEVLDEYDLNHKNIEKIIIDKGFVSPDDSKMLLELYYQVSFLKLSEVIIDNEALAFLNEDFCRKNKVVPISLDEDKLQVAFADPDDVMALDAIKQSTGKEIQVVLSSEEEILRTIDLYYAAKVAAESTTDRLKRAAERRDLPEDKRAEFIITEETPVVKLVNDIIVKGIKGNASDIHIEPTRDDFMVRFRIDGILRVFLNAPITLHAGVISRIKIMSGMDITEKRMPQDGRAEIKAKNRIIDLRVSTVPSIFGEKLVIRILDKKMGIMDLDQLGFYSENLQKVLNVIQHSYGMVLICGPTGSGKTSTGYSICNTTKSIQKNTVSVEDPVEYQIEGITQIQVNHDIGLTFSKV